MRNVKGITLVALCITMIVMLILAAVTINTFINDSSLIAKAQEASNKYNVAARNEANAINTYLKQGNEGEGEAKTIVANHLSWIEDFWLVSRNIVISAQDEVNGIEKIELPDGTEIVGNKIDYRVTKPGMYNFKIFNKLGQIKNYPVTVTNIITNEMLAKFETAITNGTAKEYTDNTTGTINVPITKPGYALVQFICKNNDQDGGMWPFSYNYELEVRKGDKMEKINQSVPSDTNEGDFETCIVRINAQDMTTIHEMISTVYGPNGGEQSMQQLGQKYTFKVTVIED